MTCGYERQSPQTSYLLAESTTQTLGDKFAQISNSVETLAVACQTAREYLGEAQVEAAPIDQTVIGINWKAGFRHLPHSRASNVERSETCYAYPSCAIQPKNSTDMSTSIQITNFFQVKFSVRSGGHSPNPGWSSVGSEVILLDLQRLDSVTLSSNGTVASLGPGERWNNAMTVLNAQGVSVQGGRLGQVAVGGLLLGVSWLLPAVLLHI
jgi:hypothetical protein